MILLLIHLSIWKRRLTPSCVQTDRRQAMGAALDKCTGRKHKRKILILGLAGVGKSQILYRMVTGEVIQTFPTGGQAIETVHHKNVEYIVYELGGRDKIRPLWRQYFRETSGLIWVVDASDPTSMSQQAENIGYVDSSSRYELDNVLSADEMRGVPLLILANKMDHPNSVSVNEVVQRLGCNLWPARTRPWHIQYCSAINKEDECAGVMDGMNWLTDQVLKFVPPPPVPLSTGAVDPYAHRIIPPEDYTKHLMEFDAKAKEKAKATATAAAALSPYKSLNPFKSNPVSTNTNTNTTTTPTTNTTSAAATATATAGTATAAPLPVVNSSAVVVSVDPLPSPPPPVVSPPSNSL